MAKDKKEILEEISELLKEGRQINEKIKQLIVRLEKQNEDKETNELDSIIFDFLNKVGIPTNVSGYRYLQKTLKLTINNDDYLLVTKKLYPKLAKEFKVKASSIERGIRTAIELGCHRHGRMYEVFEDIINKDTGTPTNAQFISFATQKLKIENGL